jgi:hypothetical protein
MESDNNGLGDKLLMFENKHLHQLIGCHQPNHPQDVQQSNAHATVNAPAPPSTSVKANKTAS